MRPALAAIPDSYIELANEHNGWFYFVSTLAIIIQAMQITERVVMRVFVGLILWPFMNIRRAMHDTDSMIVEHISASAAGLMALWLHWGRQPTEVYRTLSAIAPTPVLIALTLTLCISQFYFSSRGPICRRGVLSILACGWWTILTLVLMHQTGFFLVHIFSLPLMLACGLSVWALYEKVDNGPTNNAKPPME